MRDDRTAKSNEMQPFQPDSATPSLERRYDVDWIRTLAMGLLIVYHVVLSFQPWASIIGFPRNDQVISWIWIPMAMLNVWRIPILFLVSGMGVRFAMERRDWKQLLADRTIRILLPWLFGIVVLESLVRSLLAQLGWEAPYQVTFGHLWFLLNIFLYVIWTLAIFIYLKDSHDNPVFRIIRRILSWRYGIFLFTLPVIAEAVIISPKHFSSYVDSLHGWILGLICFIYGFLFISVQADFWKAVKRARWAALLTAILLYVIRLVHYRLSDVPNGLQGLESMTWMIAVIGFASIHLNRSSKLLKYFSEAVYPVYILHLPLQFILAYHILSTRLPAEIKLLLLLCGTFGFSLLIYELAIKRLKWIRPLFGMKWERKKRSST